MELDYEKFKETCIAEETKAKSKRITELQARKIGNHHLGSYGYTRKRPVWAKEDVQHETHGLPNLLEECNNPEERDFIKTQYKLDKKAWQWYTDAPMREFMRIKDWL